MRALEEIRMRRSQAVHYHTQVARSPSSSFSVVFAWPQPRGQVGQVNVETIQFKSELIGQVLLTMFCYPCLRSPTGVTRGFP